MKGKKKGGSNIRQAPYYIKDGDTIGVKVICLPWSFFDFVKKNIPRFEN